MFGLNLNSTWRVSFKQHWRLYYLNALPKKGKFLNIRFSSSCNEFELKLESDLRMLASIVKKMFILARAYVNPTVESINLKKVWRIVKQKRMACFKNTRTACNVSCN